MKNHIPICVIVLASLLAGEVPSMPPAGAGPGNALLAETDEQREKRRRERRRRERELKRERDRERRREEAIKEFNEIVEKAREAILDEHFPWAKKMIAAAVKKSESMNGYGKGEINELIADLKETARRMLNRANDDFAEGKYKEAIKTYSRLVKTVGDLPAGKEAAEKLQAARKDPAVKRELEELDAAKAYEVIAVTLEAERTRLAEKADPEESEPPAAEPTDEQLVLAMAMRKQARILKQLAFIKKRFAETDTGTKATELLNQLEANKEFIESIRKWEAEDNARRSFKMAQTYDKAGMHSKAIARYEEFLEEYPESEYVAQAKARIAELRRISRPD